MDNGTYKYDLEMNAPLGKRRGNLELIVWNDFLNGTLTMFTRTFPIREGKLDTCFDGRAFVLYELSGGQLHPDGCQYRLCHCHCQPLSGTKK